MATLLKKKEYQSLGCIIDVLGWHHNLLKKLRAKGAKQPAEQPAAQPPELRQLPAVPSDRCAREL
jgi:hypothetical protein